MYKGKLKTGEEVAVKVQRPFVLETVTVDLFIIRSAAPCDPQPAFSAVTQHLIVAATAQHGRQRRCSEFWFWPRRKIGLFMRRFPQLQTDVVALLDEWAVHFFEELDYVHEVCPEPLRGIKSYNIIPQAMLFPFAACF